MDKAQSAWYTIVSMWLLLHDREAGVHLLLKLLAELLLGLLKLLVSELGDFSHHLAAHSYQRSILHAPYHC